MVGKNETFVSTATAGSGRKDEQCAWEWRSCRQGGVNEANARYEYVCTRPPLETHVYVPGMYVSKPLPDLATCSNYRLFLLYDLHLHRQPQTPVSPPDPSVGHRHRHHHPPLHHSPRRSAAPPPARPPAPRQRPLTAFEPPSRSPFPHHVTEPRHRPKALPGFHEPAGLAAPRLPSWTWGTRPAAVAITGRASSLRIFPPRSTIADTRPPRASSPRRKCMTDGKVRLRRSRLAPRLARHAAPWPWLCKPS